MDQLTSNGFTGSKAKFVVDLPRHSLSFSTKVEVSGRDFFPNYAICVYAVLKKMYCLASDNGGESSFGGLYRATQSARFRGVHTG